jgi:hypothetical protein
MFLFGFCISPRMGSNILPQGRAQRRHVAKRRPGLGFCKPVGLSNPFALRPLVVPNQHFRHAAAGRSLMGKHDSHFARLHRSKRCDIPLSPSRFLRAGF